MEKTIKCAVVAALTLAAVQCLQAQEDTYPKRIEVTRDYIPEMERNAKIDVRPKLADTVILRPEVDYGIQTVKWTTDFKTDDMPSVGISTVGWDKNYPLSVKAGVSYPLTSLADIYYTPLVWRDGQLTTYINHRGIETSIENDMGDDRDALKMNSTAGVVLTKALLGGMSAQVDAKCSVDAVRPYGGFSTNGLPMVYGSRLKYNDAEASLLFGHDFSDLSHFNLQAGVSGNYFWTKQASNKYAQSGFEAFVRLGRNFWGMDMSVDVAYEGRYGLDDLSDFSDTRWIVTPRISFRPKFMTTLNLDLSARYILNDSPITKRTILLPDVRVELDKFNGFVPYLSLTGNLGDGSYRSLVERNPYIVAGAWTNNTLDIDYKVGVEGDFSVVKYNLSVGLDDISRYNYFVSVDASSRFSVYSHSVRLFYVDAMADVAFARGLTLSLSARLCNPNVDEFSNQNTQVLYDGMGIHKFDGSLSLNYDYRNKFSFSLGARLLSGADYATRMSGSGAGVSQPIIADNTFLLNTTVSSVNLRAEASWRVSDTLGVFVNGENLLSDKIYVYNLYPMLGATVMGGVTIKF